MPLISCRGIAIHFYRKSFKAQCTFVDHIRKKQISELYCNFLKSFFEKLSKSEDATGLLIESRVSLGTDFYRACAAFAKLSDIYKFDKILPSLGTEIQNFKDF